MPTSSAATERSWSAHKFIYSDRRHHIGLEKVNKLVCLYWNQRSVKPLQKVISDPSELEDAIEDDAEDGNGASGICYEVEDDSCSDDDEDDEDLLSRDNTVADEQVSHVQQMDNLLDYSYEFLGTEFSA
ncbi:zinc finger bed domain-containing protein 1-like [Phytophthora cinnamomi]|uniref:zinc finger bed domain-containing protein 1-like n=1 Tax=Phytophthora cinnamomi TaxID=4785 RepID=UPI003559D679|nr:zinc finger bed domain-containing protein 1-like [Phytophthora cinnamomi]